MEELKAQLEKIIKIARPVEEKIETAKILKRALCLMKKYPPYQYASADKKISVLIVGEGERASQLFRLIYGCCGQVLDYGLHKPGEKKESDDIALSRPSEDDGAGWIE